MIPHAAELIDRIQKELVLGDDCQDALYGLLESAIAYVETQTNRWWGETTKTTEYHEGGGTRDLYLLSRPTIDPVPEIVVTARTLPQGAGDELDSSAYQLRRAPRLTWLTRVDGQKWKHDTEYIVEFNHGYSEDPLPDDIVQVIVARVQRGWLNVGNVQEGGVQRETFDNYSYSRFGGGSGGDDIVGLGPEQQILDTWRLPVLA